MILGYFTMSLVHKLSIYLHDYLSQVLYIYTDIISPETKTEVGDT